MARRWRSALAWRTLRVMAGAHFVTDAVFAGVFTYLIIWIVHGLIYRWPTMRLSDEAIEGAIEKVGLACRAGCNGLATAPQMKSPSAEAGEDDSNIKRRRGR